MVKILSKIKNINYVEVIKLLMITTLMFVCCSASVGRGYLTPFCFGIYYTFVFRKNKAWLTSVLFCVVYLLVNTTLTSVYVCANLVGCALLFKGLHMLIKKPAHNLLVCLYALIGNAAYLVLSFTDLKSFVLAFISVIIGLMFLLCCLHLWQLKSRNIRTKFSTDEIMCVAAIVCVYAMGVAKLNVFNIELFKVIGVCLILLFSYVANVKTLLVFSGLFGLGVALHYTNACYVATFVVMALCAVGFKSGYKIIACLALLLCEVVFGLYFMCYANFNVYSLISVGLGELIFMFIPTKILNGLSDKINGATENVAVRSIINRSRENIFKRMIEVSNVFVEMDIVYKQMVQGALPESDAKQMIKGELFEKCCKDCPNRNKCFRVNGNLSYEVFNDVVNVGFEKGKLTLIDVPQYLTTTCTKVNVLILTLNALLKSYKNYAVMVNNMDASKILIADQLKGVSGIIKTLAEEVNLNIVYDLNKENRIKEEFGYKNICCLEAIVYEQSVDVKYVSLILVEKEIDKQKVEKVVSKIIGVKMQVCTIQDSAVAGAKEVVLKTKPNFDIVFGSASQTKTGKVLSGDTHSLIKIDDGKYMVALCDGMGSGEQAHKISDLTITLIENFYKAGFDNDIILNSVNKLLSLNNFETFSALDVCVLDLRKNIMDFIKLGSPFGFIKHKNETEIISSSGLPIGVLDEMKPHITKKVFTDFDIVVLVSDGVSDAFGGGEEVQNFINNSNTINPQTLADEVLDRAIDLVNGNCADDFTVVALRIFPVA